MLSLYEYMRIHEEEGGMGPGNVMGMGNPDFSTDGLISAPEGGLPKEKITIYKRRKKKKKRDPRDFNMVHPKEEQK